MRRAPVAWCVAVLLAGSALACNAVLGIDEASPEPAGDGGTGGTGDSGGPEPLTCGHYCDVIMKNCTGANQEYLTRDICVSMCQVFDLGTISDSADDTLGCRIWHADVAAESPAIHCRHAGPLGGQHCGDTCQAFCDLDTTYCSGAESAYDGGLSACRGTCPGYAYDIGPDAGDLTTESGDTLNCRLWHLETAYGSSAAAPIHCPHTGLDSATCQ